MIKSFIFLLSLIISDDTDNVDYFIYKFNLSKKDQKRLLFLNGFFSTKINSKNFSMLTLDFRLSAIANVILRDFKIINKNLTFYFQDIHGESYSKFKRFNSNWWLRRKQAHDFIKKIK